MVFYGVQMPSHGRGHKFEPCTAHQINQRLRQYALSLFHFLDNFLDACCHLFPECVTLPAITSRWIDDAGYPVDDFARGLLVQRLHVLHGRRPGVQVEGAHLITDGYARCVVSGDGHGQSVLSRMIATTGNRYARNEAQLVDLGRRNDHEPMSISDLVSCCWVWIDPVHIAGGRNPSPNQINSLPTGSPSLAQAVFSARTSRSCSVTPASNSSSL